MAIRILNEDWSAYQSDYYDDVLAQQQAEEEERQREYDRQLQEAQAAYERQLAEFQQQQAEAAQRNQAYDYGMGELTQPVVPDYQVEQQQAEATGDLWAGTGYQPTRFNTTPDQMFRAPNDFASELSADQYQVPDLAGVPMGGGGRLAGVMPVGGTGYTPRDQTEYNDQPSPGDTLTLDQPAPYQPDSTDLSNFSALESEAFGAPAPEAVSPYESPPPVAPEPEPLPAPAPITGDTDRGIGQPYYVAGDPNLVPNQFASGLSTADAYAVCGPAAAVAFARAMGRNPTMQEALQLARQVGWTPQQGMAGPQSQVRLMSSLGIESHLEMGAPNEQNIWRDVSGGNPVIISTPNHYFVVDGFNPANGTYHVGNSGTAYRVGAPWLTMQQIRSIGNGIQGAIYLDNPLTPQPSVAASEPTEPTYTSAAYGDETSPGDTLTLGTPVNPEPAPVPDLARFGYEDFMAGETGPAAADRFRAESDARIAAAGGRSAFEGVTASGQVYPAPPEPNLLQRGLGAYQGAVAAVGSVPIAPGPYGPITLGDVGGTLDEIRRQTGSELAMPAQALITYPEQIWNERQRYYGDLERTLRDNLQRYGPDDPRTQQAEAAFEEARRAITSQQNEEYWLDVARRNPAYENVVGATDLGLQGASFVAAPGLVGGVRGTAAALLDPAQQLGNVPFAAAERIPSAVGAIARNIPSIPEAGGLLHAPAPTTVEPIRGAAQAAVPDRGIGTSSVTVLPGGIPARVQRIEEEGVAAGSTAKPQGLYTSPADVQSPHADLGGAQSFYDVNPDARVLTVDMENSPILRRGAVGSGTGVVALKQLVGDDTFNQLVGLDKPALIENLTRLYPDVDWGRYYDKQEILEGLGGLVARERGYDAIWGEGRYRGRPDPEFSEFVALNENAFRANLPTRAMVPEGGLANAGDSTLNRLQDQIDFVRERLQRATPEEAPAWQENLQRLVDEYDQQHAMESGIDRILASGATRSPWADTPFSGLADNPAVMNAITSPTVEQGVTGAIAGGYGANQEENASPADIALGAGLGGLGAIGRARLGQKRTERLADPEVGRRALGLLQRTGREVDNLVTPPATGATADEGRAAAERLRAMYENPNAEGGAFSFGALKNDIVRLMVDDRIDLKAAQDQVAKAYAAQTHGAPLPLEARAVEFDRLSRGVNGRAGIRIQQDLMPVIQDLTPPQQNLLRDAMTLADNLDKAAAIEKDAGKAAADARLFSGGLTRAQSEAALVHLQQTVSPENWAKVDQAAEHIYTQFVDPLRDRMLDAGIWSEDLVRQLKTEFPHYMPTIILDHLDDPHFIPPGQKIGLGDIGLKHLTEAGTTSAREDPFVSMMRMAFEVERRAAKNEAFQAVYSWRNIAPEFGDVMRVLQSGEAAGKGEIIMPGFVDGVKVNVATSKPMADAISFLNTHGVLGDATVQKWVGRLSGADLLRMGATERNPIFALAKNPIVDFPTYLIRMEADYGPRRSIDIAKAYGEALADSFRGFRSGTIGGEARQRFYRGGGAQAGVFSADTTDLQNWVRKLEQPPIGKPVELGAYLIRNPKELLRTIWDATTMKWVSEFGARLEDTPRVAAMLMHERFGPEPISAVLPSKSERLAMGDLRRPALESGAAEQIAGGAPLAETPSFGRPRGITPEGGPVPYEGRSTPYPNIEAIMAGRQVTQDFATGGQVTKVLNSFMPFFNVSFQGVPWMARLIADHPKEGIATLATMVGAPAVLSTVWNRADADRSAAYDDVPDWVKRQGLVIMKPQPVTSPNERGQRRPDYWIVPMRTAQPLAIMAREATERTMGKATPREWQEVLTDLIGSASPLQVESPISFLGSVMPVTLGTFAQLVTDKDFFTGGSIKSQARDERATAGSRFIAEHTGGAATPSQVEFAIREQTAGLGGIALAAADLGARLREGRSLVPYNAAPSEFPGVGGLVGAFSRQSGGQVDQDLQRLRNQTQDNLTNAAIQRMGPRFQQMSAPQQEEFRRQTHAQARETANRIVFGTGRDPLTEVQDLERRLRLQGAPPARMSQELANLRDRQRQQRRQAAAVAR